MHDVSNKDLVNAHVDGLSVSCNVDIFAGGYFVEFAELLFLHIVVERSDSSDDGNCKKNGDPFEPALLDSVGGDS